MKIDPKHKKRGGQMQKAQIPNHLEIYFLELEKEGINLTHAQKIWYWKKYNVLGEKIRQEFPSTAQESFLASADAYFYANEIQQARKDRRIIPLRYNPEHLVYVSFDIGVFDHTVLWFYQVYDQQIYFIDYYEDNNKSYDFYLQHMLQNKSYHYGTVFLPHDSHKRDDVTLITYADKVRKILQEKHIDVIVLKKDDIITGINLTKVMLNRCYIDDIKCAQGIDHLTKYKRRWHEQAGWIHEPMKTIHNHAADSMRYACLSLDQIKVHASQDLEKHKKAVAMSHRLI
jgi:hypothetical protein